MLRRCLKCGSAMLSLAFLMLLSLIGVVLIWPYDFKPELCAPHIAPSEKDVTLQSILRESFVEVAPNVQLHVNEAGPEDAKKIIVFLHGFPESGQITWRDQIIHFANAGYNVIAPDMRGYNTSSKPTHVSEYSLRVLVQDVAMLVSFKVKKDSQLFLVAHDWGGIVAWRTLITHHDMFHKAVILNAPHPAAMRDAPPSQLLKSWYIFFFNLPASIVNYRLEKDDYAMFMDSTVGHAAQNSFSLYDVERLKKTWAIRGELEAITHYYRALVRDIPSTERDPAKLRVKTPTLVLWGETDLALDPKLAYASSKYGDAIIARVFPNVGHWLTHEIPEKVTEEIEAYFEM